MKKKYEAPTFIIQVYSAEDIITVSSNSVAMGNDMISKGYSVTYFKLNS